MIDVEDVKRRNLVEDPVSVRQSLPIEFGETILEGLDNLLLHKDLSLKKEENTVILSL